jgi:hypothetical protein
VPLEGEKHKLDFMKFTSKTLGQLHITTSNMPSSITFGTYGSVKTPYDQNVQKTRKKRKVEKVENLMKDAGEGSYKANSPPSTEFFAQVAEHARELIEDSSQQFEAMLAQRALKKAKEASLQEEAENVKAVEVHEGIPQNAGENSVDQDQRVEENTEKDTQNVDEDTHEVAELLASNMNREEAVPDENM